MGSRSRRSAVFEPVAPDKGIIDILPSQVLDDRAWTDALNVGFDRGRAFRWPGHNPFAYDKNLIVPGDTIGFVTNWFDYMNQYGFAANIKKVLAPFVDTIPSGFPNQAVVWITAYEGALRNYSENDIFFGFGTEPRSFLNPLVHDENTYETFPLHTVRNVTIGSVNFCIAIAVGDWTGLYPGLISVLDASIDLDVIYSFASLMYNVDPVDPLRQLTIGTSPNGVAVTPTDTWKGADRSAILAYHRVTPPGLNFLSYIAAVPAVQGLDAIDPLWADPDTYDGGIAFRPDIPESEAVVGTSIGVNLGVAGDFDYALLILNGSNDVYKHPIGMPGAEPILLIFDYVKDPSTRFLIIITTEHVYYYDVNNEAFYTISEPDGVFTYNTGTVATGGHQATGGGGADFVVGAVAPFDMIQVAAVDSRYRVISSIDSATLLQLTAEIAVNGATPYVIERALRTYSLTDRPWALTFQGKLLIGSLATSLAEWDGVTAQMAASTPAGATPIPKAKTATIIANRPVFGHTDPGTGTPEPQVLRWPDSGTYNDFDNGEAGYLAVSESKEEIVRVEKLAEYGVVFCKDSVHLISYVGVPFVYSRRQIAMDIGCIATHMVSVLDDRLFFVSQNNLYMITQQGLQAIGDQIQDRFFRELDLLNVYKGYAEVNKEKKEWMISYPSRSGGGVPDRMAVYNYRNNSWTFAANNGYSAIGQVKLAATANVKGEDINVPANEYTLRYDEVTQTQYRYAILLGAIGNDGNEEKMQRIEFAAQLESYLEKEGIRLAGEKIDSTESIKLVRIRFDFERDKAVGKLIISVGAKMHEGEPYEVRTQEYDMANGGRGHVDFRLTGRIFKLRIETRDDEPTNYSLNHYRMEGEIGGNR